MSWLPEGTALGELRLEESFVDFDGPRVFWCQAPTDQRYLVVWAEDRADDDLWLYAPVSAKRLQMVRSGGLALREAFEHPEGPVYLVSLPRAATGSDSVRTLTLPINDEWLPETDFRLNLQTDTLPHAEGGDVWRRRAMQERRGRVRLMVKWPGLTRSEAPTRKVGELLVSTQSLYDNVGLALLQSEPPQAGRIPFEVAEQTATDVVWLSAASFVIDIASTNYDDLFDDSVFAQITRHVLDLLDTSLERDDLIERLVELRPRGAKSFRNFVKGLASTGGSVTFAGAGSTLEYTARELSADRLETLSAILTNLVPEDVFEIRGRMRLYRADMDRKQFGVKDELTDQRYEGTIAQRALVQVDHATVNEIYDVLVSEFSTFDEAVGERKPVFVLDQLSPSDPDAPLGPAERTRIGESAITAPDEG
ncbi:DUF6575 domain-containing protein [Nocardioides allogilvus]|uniref:DUF6575 domain-containing protein n=1 Tax=Nocardioides allogilvus TaxID=2072017 RepID=UPI00130086EF|nr:DUF6575 domain-containing protein [Nocardioides allogilvus]